MRLVDYSQDVSAEGMLHAAFVRSAVPHGRVRSVEASGLPPGCVALLPRGHRRPRALRVPIEGPDGPVRSGPLRGRHRGRGGGAHAEAARAAAKAMSVEMEELPAVFDPLAAVAEGAPLLHPETGDSAGDEVSIGVRPLAGTNVCHRFRLLHGDVRAGFAEADVVVEETFSTAGGPARADGAARDARRLDRRRPARGANRHADALQPARRPGRGLRNRTRSASA